MGRIPDATDNANPAGRHLAPGCDLTAARNTYILPAAQKFPAVAVAETGRFAAAFDDVISRFV